MLAVVMEEALRDLRVSCKGGFSPACAELSVVVMSITPRACGN